MIMHFFVTYITKLYFYFLGWLKATNSYVM